jgi:hypothetical protein
MIEIVDTLEREEQLKQEMLRAEEVRRERAARRVADVREQLLIDLELLAAGLGRFYQTTHGAFFRGGGIGAVCAMLHHCWEDPTAYNISELSQVVQAFARVYRNGGESIS